MLPELFHFGPFHLRSFGVMLALAFLAGTWIALKEARRRGLDESYLLNLVLVILVASIVGARGMYAVTHTAEFDGRPLAVFAIWEGGLTLYGGLVLAILAGIAYCRWVGLPLWPVADTFAPAVALGMALGRVGCFLTGCCFGLPSKLPWAVHFPPHAYGSLQFPGEALQPSQLYFTVAELIILGVLLAARHRLRVPGQLWWLFVMLDSLTRYLIDFTRYYEPSAYIAPGVEMSQAISIALFFVGLAMFLFLGSRETGKAKAAAEHASR